MRKETNTPVIIKVMINGLQYNSTMSSTAFNCLNMSCSRTVVQLKALELRSPKVVNKPRLVVKAYMESQ